MLIGKIVDLRAVEISDTERCHYWLNDPEIRDYLSSFAFPISYAKEEKSIQQLQFTTKTDKVFAIITKKGEHIGNIGLHGIDCRNGNAELGMFIGDKNNWNKGYGTDAVKTFLKFCFEELNLNRVDLGTVEFNPRAVRCYEKCGFVVEGRNRQSVYLRGRFWDTIEMAILKEEWPSNGYF